MTIKYANGVIIAAEKLAEVTCAKCGCEEVPTEGQCPMCGTLPRDVITTTPCPQCGKQYEVSFIIGAKEKYGNYPNCSVLGCGAPLWMEVDASYRFTFNIMGDRVGIPQASAFLTLITTLQAFSVLVNDPNGPRWSVDRLKTEFANGRFNQAAIDRFTDAALPYADQLLNPIPSTSAIAPSVVGEEPVPEPKELEMSALKYENDKLFLTPEHEVLAEAFREVNELSEGALERAVMEFSPVADLHVRFEGDLEKVIDDILRFLHNQLREHEMATFLFVYFAGRFLTSEQFDPKVHKIKLEDDYHSLKQAVMAVFWFRGTAFLDEIYDHPKFGKLMLMSYNRYLVLEKLVTDAIHEEFSQEFVNWLRRKYSWCFVS